MMKAFAALIAIAAFTTTAQAGNFADCILERMPGTANQQAAMAVFRSCGSEHPRQYEAIEQGSGLGFFGFKDQDACIIKKSKDTTQSNAAFMISRACRCLYQTPIFKGEMCDQPKVNWENGVIAPPAEPTRPPPVAVVAPAPPPQPSTPAPAATKSQQGRNHHTIVQPPPAEKPRFTAEQQSDLDAAVNRALQDYPYLNTPAGVETVQKITQRRDELIRQGVYPSTALQRAVNAFAPGNAP